ncbi:hypothetical protein TNCV_4717071 [Trichonephila clavipes]|nr:hypothetical protein TNCV_4717071 [Trichonephila clavipes]
MSRTRALMPLKSHRVEQLMHIKFVESQNHPVGEMWFREGGASSGFVLAHLIIIQNYENSETVIETPAAYFENSALGGHYPVKKGSCL